MNGESNDRKQQGAFWETLTDHHKRIFIGLFCWTMLFIGVALTFFAGRARDVEGTARVVLEAGSSFSLQGVEPDQILVLGRAPIRLEREGAAVLDADGNERDFIRWPYRDAVVRYAGDALLVVPDWGTGFMLVDRDRKTYVFDTEVPVDAADCGARVAAALGRDGAGHGVVSVYDLNTHEQTLTLTFEREGLPVAVRVSDNDLGFELLLADDAEGRPFTRFRQYDLSGNQIADHAFPDLPLLARMLSLSSRDRLLFGAESMVLVDAWTGDRNAAFAPGKLLSIDQQEGVVAVAAEEGDRARVLFHVASSGEGGAFVFSPSPLELLSRRGEPNEGESSDLFQTMALSEDGRFLLVGSDRALILLQSEDGRELSRLPVKEIRRIFSLGGASFLVVTSADASVVNVK